jgi:APA family basic amino acid/polyamine antiporter
VRGLGPKPELFKQVDKATNMPANSSIFGLLLCGFWLLYFYGANLTEPLWFGPLSFDSSELPIVTIYAAYIPIFILFMVREKDLSGVKRFLMPALSICGSLFMVIAAIFAHKMAVVWYLVLFVAVMIIGAFFSKPKKA